MPAMVLKFSCRYLRPTVFEISRKSGRGGAESAPPAWRVLNTRTAGIFGRMRSALRGGLYPFLPYSQTSGHSEAGDAAIESSQRLHCEETKNKRSQVRFRLGQGSTIIPVSFGLIGYLDGTNNSCEPKGY